MIFGDECFHIRRSGVRLDQCSCVGDFVVSLIFGSYFYGSTTIRMSTRRLPVLLFVSRFECPFVSCCLLRSVPMVAEGVIYFVCVQWHISSMRLRGLSATLSAHGYVKGYSVDCFCPDISYILYMSVSCPSGLCLSASLPLVTSQARLESDVLEPQPGVTAGFAVCSRLWVFRTGIQWSLLSPVSRLGSALGLRLSSC